MCQSYLGRFKGRHREDGTRISIWTGLWRLQSGDGLACAISNWLESGNLSMGFIHYLDT